MKSQFYTVEGLDGCGKSSISKYMNEYLTERGIPSIVVEAYPRDESAMFLRDLWIQKKVPDIAVLAIILQLRLRVLNETIIPALLAGKVVISDRWHDSTWAYQQWGMGISGELIEAVYDDMFNLSTITSPYSPETAKWLRNQIRCYNTVHLDIDLETSRSRVSARPGMKDAFEKSSDAFFNRLSDGYRYRYHQRMKIDPDSLFMVDARRPLDDVKKCIRSILGFTTAPVPPKE